MTDVLDQIAALTRPKTLVVAAQHAKAGYRRMAHLPRLLGHTAMPAGTACVAHLLDLESEMNDRRRDKDTTYSAQRHIDILAALLSESDALRAATIFFPAAAEDALAQTGREPSRAAR